MKRKPSMTNPTYLIKQLAQELAIPESGKQSLILMDNTKIKTILFSFAVGSGLAEHVAPLDATLQIISGQAAITVGEESVAGVPGTWVQMMAKTPHSIKAVTPVVMLLTLHK
jgi:quercetin dioxygenase-like cupin family protein